MIPANHKPLHVWFFHLYSRWMLQWHFREVKLHISGMKAPDKPVLLIGNHFSWWDGFIADYLNSEFFRKKLYIMMLEEQLSKRMFLSKAGAFSVRRSSRSVIESLDYASGLLHDQGNLLVMYPQGEIRSMHQRPARFGKGVSKILKDSSGDKSVFFYAALVDYFSSRRPRLDIYLKCINSDQPGILEKEFNKFVEESISYQNEE